jgi:hypothetical protein
MGKGGSPHPTIAKREKLRLDRAATARRGAPSQYDGPQVRRMRRSIREGIAMQAMNVGVKVGSYVSRLALAAAFSVAAGSALAEPKTNLRTRRSRRAA